MTDHDQPLDLPFELNPPGQHLDLANAKLSGGCIVMASVIPDKPPRPALVFRFAAPDGRFYAPIVLAIDPAKADALPALIHRATHAAINAAGPANPKDTP